MNEYMKMAKELAIYSLENNIGGPFGAVVVKDGKVIGKGSNQVIKENDPTAHAEILAIRDACKNLNTYDLTGCEIYTSCYPCPMCLSAIIWSNIKKVYYGNTNEDAKMIGFRDKYIYDVFNDINNNDNKLLELKCIDREETIKAFYEYLEKDDKAIY